MTTLFEVNVNDPEIIRTLPSFSWECHGTITSAYLHLHPRKSPHTAPCEPHRLLSLSNDVHLPEIGKFIATVP